MCVSGGLLCWVDLPTKQDGVWPAPVPAMTEADECALKRWAEELRDYFEGKRLSWAPSDLDAVWLPSGDFRRKVCEQLVGVAAGETVAYGELAAMAGHPGAARAVGTVMATNPVPVVVPCHRVIRSDGSLGWYGGIGKGTDWKRRLLGHEKSWVKRSE